MRQSHTQLTQGTTTPSHRHNWSKVRGRSVWSVYIHKTTSSYVTNQPLGLDNNNHLSTRTHTHSRLGTGIVELCSPVGFANCAVLQAVDKGLLYMVKTSYNQVVIRSHMYKLMITWSRSIHSCNNRVSRTSTTTTCCIIGKAARHLLARVCTQQ